MLKREIDIIIKLNDQENKYQVKFPTVGQLIDINSDIIRVSDGTHSKMLFSTSRSAQMSYIAIEAISTFKILIPDLIRDLRVESIYNLSPIQIKPLVEAYTKVYYPWFNKWLDEMDEAVNDAKSEAVNDAGEEAIS